MVCGVKFCGGCNPRYDRGEAFEQLKLCFAEENIKKDEELNQRVEARPFDLAKEGVPYDLLLVIGGCPACCASYSQYTVAGDIVKMWDENHIKEIAEKLKSAMQ